MPTTRHIPRGLSFLYRPTRYIEYGTIPDPSGFDSIPNEVLSEIFKHSLPPIPNFKRMENEDQRRNAYIDLMTSPIKLSAVCRRWRGAALRTPQLWTFFGYHSYADYTWNGVYEPPDKEMIYKWFERSASLPLTIFVSSWGPDEVQQDLMFIWNTSTADKYIFEAISSVSHRWKYVYFNMPSTECENPPPPGVPMSVRLPHLNLMLPMPDFSNTTTLHIKCWTVQDFINLAEGAPQLESLTVSFVARAPIDTRDYSRKARVLLQHLRKLDIDDFHGTRNIIDTEELFDRITTPALTHLSIPIHHNGSGRFAVKLIDASQCKLEEIRFEQATENIDNVDMGNIGTLLKFAPAVKVITVENWRGYQQNWDRDGVSRWILEFLAKDATCVRALERVQHVFEYGCNHCGPFSVQYAPALPLNKDTNGGRREFVMKFRDSLEFLQAKHIGHPHEVARDPATPFVRKYIWSGYYR